MSSEFTIVPVGPFSLRESALFGFGQRANVTWNGTMSLAFCLDDYETQVGVDVRQDKDGVHCITQGEADITVVRAQVARVLSLADDATGFVEVAQRDPIVALLQEAAPGLRPPLFYSAYEAACWCILSARRQPAQMREVRRRLSAAHGAGFELAEGSLAAFPTPRQLLSVKAFPGIPTAKLERLHRLARAALEGQLDSDLIRETEAEQAMNSLQGLPGIGPFYSSLIYLRAVGVRDVLPPDEQRVRKAAAQLYQLPGVPSIAEFEAIARPWRPWRTWVCVLMRAAAGRVS